MSEIRTRFAPSPTGFIHVGNVRTALFCWLFAHSQNGSFVLRIEDTDKSREVEGSIDHIINSLNWLGLIPDEGPGIGGNYGPYIQSERLESYRAYVQKLIDKGLAYADPYTEEEVTRFREQSKAANRPFLFREYRPDDVSVPENWYKQVPIRFKVSDIKRYTWHDVVRGKLSAGEEALDDLIIMKSDGYPTYNFAHIIDDYEMKISHIFRGEEFIPSTPKFLSLYDALEITPPEFVTVPPILGQTGGKKMSKRDGAKDVLDYKNDGYLPQTILNFLASLGWNDGTKQEIFTPEELVKAFSLSRIQRSGARWDETKLDWMEWQHRLKQLEQNPGEVLESLGVSEERRSPEFARLAASKARSLADFKDQYAIFTNPDEGFSIQTFDLSQIDADLTQETAKTYLSAGITALESLSDFTEQTVEATLRAEMEQQGASPRAFLNLLRWAICNQKVSPNLFGMIAVLGKERSVARLKNAL